MPKLFSPNLERAGRILRAVLGSLLLVGGIVAMFWQVAAGMILLASGAFVLFEAARGWCFVRACGIKTRI